MSSNPKVYVARGGRALEAGHQLAAPQCGQCRTGVVSDFAVQDEPLHRRVVYTARCHGKEERVEVPYAVLVAGEVVEIGYAFCPPGEASGRAHAAFRALRSARRFRRDKPSRWGSGGGTDGADAFEYVLWATDKPTETKDLPMQRTEKASRDLGVSSRLGAAIRWTG